MTTGDITTAHVFTAQHGHNHVIFYFIFSAAVPYMRNRNGDKQKFIFQHRKNRGSGGIMRMGVFLYCYSKEAY